MRHSMGMRSPFWVVLGTAFALGVGCGDGGPSPATVSVDVRTGLVPGPEFSTVRLDVFESSPIGAHNLLERRERPAVVGEDFATGIRVAELDLPPGDYRIRVQLLRADLRVLIGFTRLVTVDAGEARFETIPLTRDCVGEAVCPLPGASAALSECLAGQCVDPRCEPPDPEFCGGLVFCTADAECAAEAECATSRCIDGLCTPQAIEGACGTTEFCDPQDGCTDVRSVMTEIPCGEFCEMDCVAGIWSCTPSGATCEVVSFKDAGVACGPGSAGTCDGAGACVL